MTLNCLENPQIPIFTLQDFAVGTVSLFPPYNSRRRGVCLILPPQLGEGRGGERKKSNPSENTGIFLCSDYGGGLKKQEKPETNAGWPEESERKRKIPVFSRPDNQKSKIKTF